MTRLDLTAEEASILITALESYVSDLRMEIADTEAMDFREALKTRRDTLNQILERLRAPGPVSQNRDRVD